MKEFDRQKIEVAQTFIAYHRADIVNAHRDNTQSQWLEVFNKLMGDAYGEVRTYDDDPNWKEIEIGGLDSKTGQPVIFEFYYKEVLKCELNR